MQKRNGLHASFIMARSNRPPDAQHAFPKASVSSEAGMGQAASDEARPLINPDRSAPSSVADGAAAAVPPAAEVIHRRGRIVVRVACIAMVMTFLAQMISPGQALAAVSESSNPVAGV